MAARPRCARPVILLLAALVGLLLAGCGGGAAADHRAGGERAAGSADLATATATTVLSPCPAQPDRPAQGPRTLPRLRLPCVGGGALDLGKAPGVPTVVNLWGSWCTPCREELPLVQQFAQAAGGRVRVVGVISKDGLPQAESFAEDAGLTFPSAFDGQGDLMAGVGINVLPYTYFLDADGALAYTQVGPVRSVDELRRLVAEHLKVQL